MQVSKECVLVKFVKIEFWFFMGLTVVIDVHELTNDHCIVLRNSSLILFAVQADSARLEFLLAQCQI
jgi:hypothetical protein